MASKVTGTANMKRRLAAMPPILVEKITEATREGAEEIASMQRRLAPRRTGALINSIRTEPGEGMGHFVRAGDAKAFYARFVEFGDHDTPPQPYFFASYRALRKRIRARIARAARTAIKVAVRAGGRDPPA